MINNHGGQMSFRESERSNQYDSWGMKQEINRLELWSKLGKVSKRPGTSIGSQVLLLYHDQQSYFGRKDYNGTQKGLYANIIYQGILGNSNHGFKTGINYQLDDYAEHYADHLNSRQTDTVFMRAESVPGAFFEYTFSLLDKFTLVSGTRVDAHDKFGVFVTPRLHIKYAIAPQTVVRLSAGRGQRMANILAEGYGAMSSSREFIVMGATSQYAYGLKPEVAWNYGLNFTQKFRLDYRDGYFSTDVYRTHFTNQVVADMEQDPRQVLFYNLNGKSFSNSLQVQVDYELIKRFDIRLAYRRYNVQTTYLSGQKLKPLTSKDRAFVNLSYRTRSYWQFDCTLNWQGPKRLPSTEQSPEQFRTNEESPGFFIMNAQVSKTWNEKFEIYLGAENLLNFKQNNAIIASQTPFSEYFDASMIWGPVFGREVFAGFAVHVKIKRDRKGRG
ncbi:MAG: TonB-dependent receptor, partial [Bacteroidales bacterium]|nr:TonB-dependent receptor [Bacteroidales bacterium]